MKLKKYYLEIILIMIFASIEIVLLLNFNSKIAKKKEIVEQFIVNSLEKEKSEVQDIKDIEEQNNADNEERGVKLESNKENKKKAQSKSKKYPTKNFIEGIGENKYKEYYTKNKKFDEKFIKNCIINGKFSDPYGVIKKNYNKIKKNYKKRYRFGKNFNKFLKVQMSINTITIKTPCYFNDEYWNEFFDQFSWTMIDRSIGASEVRIKEKWLIELQKALVEYRKKHFKTK